jgi:hypothetical protein
MALIRSITFALLLTQGCAMNAFAEPAACPRSPGYAEMSADGTLTVHIVQSSGVELRETHAPGSPDYRSYVAWAGNPRVGERKPIPVYSGLASMDADGVITFTHGNDNRHELTVEPTTGRIRPGDPDYQAMIDRVGGLNAGEFRGIPAQAEPGCAAGQ